MGWAARANPTTRLSPLEQRALSIARRIMRDGLTRAQSEAMFDDIPSKQRPIVRAAVGALVRTAIAKSEATA